VNANGSGQTIELVSIRSQPVAPRFNTRVSVRRTVGAKRLPDGSFTARCNRLFTILYQLWIIICVICGFFSFSPSLADTLPHSPLGAVTSLAFSPDGKRLAVGTYGEVILYDTANWQVLKLCKQIPDGVRALAFSPDGKQLALGCGLPGRDGETLVWDLDTMGLPARYPGGKDTVEALAFRADGKELLAGVNDNTALLFTAWPAATTTKLDEHNGRVTAVAFSPRTDFVFVTGGMDKIVKVWDSKTMHTVVNFDQSEAGISGLEFLPNGTQFVGASLDGKLYWWGINLDAKKREFSGYLFRSLLAHDGGVFALAMSADGKRLVTCGADDQVVVWNTDGGKLKAFKEATQPCYACVLGPDGKIAAAGGRDGLVYIWDVDGGKLLNTLTPPALPAPVKKTLPAQKPVKGKSVPKIARSQK
jgi:WD40 repeat protein